MDIWKRSVILRKLKEQAPTATRALQDTLHQLESLKIPLVKPDDIYKTQIHYKKENYTHTIKGLKGLF